MNTTTTTTYFRKRIIYPSERTNHDRVISKSAKLWCEQKFEMESTENTTQSQPTSADQHFIRDRIRHLVEAFSVRTKIVKDEMDIAESSSLDSANLTPTPSPSNIYNNNKSEDEATEDSLFQTDNEGFNLMENLKYLFKHKVIDPNGRKYIVWMMCVSLTVMYNVWVIPLRSTFSYQNPDNRWIWMWFDYMADLVYLLDMILVQPRIKFLQEGFWVKDTTYLRQNYMKTADFKLDLISLLPLDLLYIIFGAECVILRLPRFLKMHSFWHFFNMVDKLLSNPYVVRIARTLLYMLYLIHLNACAYYAFSVWEEIGSNRFVYNGLGNAYIKCFYFATKTATSIGKNPKPTNNFEFMFMTVSWLMGVFVFAVLIGQIRDVISTATRSKTEYRQLVDETLEYMRRLNLPQDLQKRVKLWFNYTWKTQHTLDENRIMDCLPHKMKTDIAINVHIDTLSKVKLFADCDEALRRELVLQLKSVIYLPGDVICKKGDVGKEMYIVKSGKVQVLGKNDEEILATLSEGSVFGEISLLGIPGMNRRTADVKSRGYSNLFVLSKKDLNAALSHYPEAQDLLNKIARQLMRKNAERKKNKLIVIENPKQEGKQAKLLDTVLKVVPPDSKTSQLLRFGNRTNKKKKEVADNKVFGIESVGICDGFKDNVFQTEATVHRTMN